jgi:predicted ester cyclase
MSVDENKQVYRQFVEQVMNQANLAALDEILAPDFVEHEHLPPGIPMNREGVKQLFAMYHGGLSDVHVRIEDEIAEGDKVVARLTVQARHTGDFAGIPATGKQVSFEVIDICRIANKKMLEHWGVTDQLTLMQQLGAIPGPA